MPKIAATKKTRNPRIPEDIEEDARQCVYNAVDAAISRIDIRRVAVAHAEGLYAKHKHKQGKAVIEAIQKMDLEIPAENLGGLSCAWIAMDITDATPDGGVGHLLENFVDLMNAPSNVAEISAKNIALILRTADRVRAHLAGYGAAAE